MLQLVATTMDGNLTVCDDSYTIDIYLPAELVKENGSQICFMFDEQGNLDGTKIH